MVKHTIARLAALAIAGLGVVVAPVAAHASAGRTVPGQAVAQLPQGNPFAMCDDWGADGSQCLNPAGGSAGFFNGNDITVGTHTFRIFEEEVGLVTNSATVHEPFNDGSNCNAKYDGDPVVLLLWNADGRFGLRDYTDRDDEVAISSTIDKNALWVQSGNWYVNVGATNSAGIQCSTGAAVNAPMILTYRPDTGTVWSRCGHCFADYKQNWTDLSQ
ncbi:MAG TPA: hypothetical protein VJT31_25745 [Rugosimonospora sp.]|nr:hypothetical protein [Rugosimonospora sp.]